MATVIRWDEIRWRQVCVGVCLPIFLAQAMMGEWVDFCVLAAVLCCLRALELGLGRAAARTRARLEAEMYPPGCTCVRGAMLDNPMCPHHGEHVPDEL